MARRLISRRVGVALFDEAVVLRVNTLLDGNWHIENIAEDELGYLLFPLEPLRALTGTRGASIIPADETTFDRRVLALVVTEGRGPRSQRLLVSDLVDEHLDVNAIRREAMERFPAWEIMFTSRLNARQALSLLER